MGIPIPGEIVLLTAAAFAAHGSSGIAGVAIAAWIGTIAGGTGGYWIGRTGGTAFLKRYGKWVGINEEREKSARAFFKKHGAKTIIIARFIAVLRMIAGILAGSAEMSFGLFSLCNAIGGLLWSVAFAALGYLFGRHLHVLEHYLREISFGLLAVLLVAGVAFWIYRRRKRKHN
jgi:LPXTG-motif cell wall-anchored protein